MGKEGKYDLRLADPPQVRSPQKLINRLNKIAVFLWRVDRKWIFIEVEIS
jgi:hypothetical protein